MYICITVMHSFIKKEHQIFWYYVNKNESREFDESKTLCISNNFQSKQFFSSSFKNMTEEYYIHVAS